MRKLSVTDHVLLSLENQKQPMNVAGLCLFEVPDDTPDNAPPFAKCLYDTMVRDNVPTFPFNQTLHKKRFWKLCDRLDLSYHFRYVCLKDTQNADEFLSYVSEQHSLLLDRHKPLWQIHLIDNIPPESHGRPSRFAMYLKLHHAMIDGVGAMRLLQTFWSDDPQTRLNASFWAIPKKRHTHHTHKAIKDTLKEQLDTLKPVGKALLQRWHDRHLPEFTSSFDAPKSLLNQRIGKARRVEIIAFAKERLQKVAKTFDVTTNDVILAVCAGGLRSYLSEKNALPKQPLIGFVPISLRQDDSMAGNQLSFLLANLATATADPKERLLHIAKSTKDSKGRFLKLNHAQIINYSLAIYGLAGLNLATRLYPTKQAFNLIISNIPGAKTPMYLNGAKLTGLFPVSVLFDGQALNITLANYQNTIDVCLTACKDILPDVDKLLEHLEQELGILENLVTTP